MFFTNIVRLREVKRKPRSFTFLRNNKICFEMLAFLMYNVKTLLVVLVILVGSWFPVVNLQLSDSVHLEPMVEGKPGEFHQNIL